MGIVSDILYHVFEDYNREADSREEDFYIRDRNFQVIKKFLDCKSKEIEEKLMEVEGF